MNRIATNTSPISITSNNKTLNRVYTALVQCTRAFFVIIAALPYIRKRLSTR